MVALAAYNLLCSLNPAAPKEWTAFMDAHSTSLCHCIMKYPRNSHFLYLLSQNTRESPPCTLR
eukprot:NODE_7371_length_404_cov_284.233803_g5716_i0.p3 GENE.NODE_7371_length_404_cov_284.233803_g5716_i0~~NODE_7371_length_404_cov_284.233803_g5716_i0.p3  ORF type:complete len:63 (-),score=17.56 NODE_7371_length_404_cov_284.233803_g5716_i0:17-205(-)